jgi:hypothetical protein
VSERGERRLGGGEISSAGIGSVGKGGLERERKKEDGRGRRRGENKD